MIVMMSSGQKINVAFMIEPKDVDLYIYIYH